jgi:carbon storage regulator
MLDSRPETFTVKRFESSAIGVASGRERAKEWSMLVLSRKKDESIVINNDITIVVVEIRGDKVRLGVEAPKEVPVHRREVFEAIARGEPLDAGSLAAPDSDQESTEPRPPATDAIP